MSSKFSNAVLKWYKHNGRYDLPWKTKDAYKLWISEIMLQQTQVKTVIPYYKTFIKKYPNLKKLANANYDDLMLIWSGLGYYRRLDNVYKSSKIIMKEHNGKFPNNFKDILSLPGIGRTTASAIYTFAGFGHKAILDGNVKRIIRRFFDIVPGIKKTSLEKLLWEKSTHITPTNKNTSNFNQAMMDIGSSICTRGKPKCNICPLKSIGCHYKHENITKEKEPQRIINKKKYLAVIIDSKKRIFLEKIQKGRLWRNLYSSPSFISKKNEIKWITNKNIPISKESKQISIQHKVTNKLFDIIASFYFLKNNKKVSLSTHNWYNLSNINVGIPKYQEKIINIYIEND